MNRFTHETQSLIFGMLGILGFSLTFPATRLAVADLDATFVGLGRALLAAVPAALMLWFARSPRPRGRQWPRLGAAAFGIVIGFPLFSSWALTQVPASHGAVVGGVLPLVTAFFGAWLAAERPSAMFWISMLSGSTVIVAFSLWSGGGHWRSADLALLLAVLAAGFGYAEGARLSRELGAWQTLCWALLLTAPILVYPVWQHMPQDWSAVGWRSVAGFVYVGMVSMFLAFIAWYQGLAQGGIARIGQLQLLQPFLTLGFAAMLLGEKVSAVQILVALIVLGCVMLGRKSPVMPAPRAVAQPD